MPRARAELRFEGAGSGFTIIELMIVITLIVIIAAIAVPNLISARMRANETAAISLMRTMTTAQSQFMQSVKADEDGDQQGEYGFLGELGGFVGVRGGAVKTPLDIGRSLAQVNAAGEVHRSGYVLRMYMPLAGGIGRREDAYGGIPAGVLDPDLSESVWACYAWPSHFGASGSRVFFVSHRSEITTTDDPGYSGGNAGQVLPGSALITTNQDSMTGKIAIGTIGNDGNLWKTAQ